MTIRPSTPSFHTSRCTIAAAAWKPARYRIAVPSVACQWSTKRLRSAFAGLLQIQDGLVQLVAYYAFWVAWLYMGMVMLRRLGLFCFRHSVVLEWFPDRAMRPE